MVLHILNKKAQINLGFVISVVLLAMVIIYVTLNLLHLVPAVKDRTEQNTLYIKANILSVLLADDPGLPKDWTTNPTRAGFAKYNNYSNRALIGVLDPSKLSYANNTALYSSIKSGIGLDVNHDFRITVVNNTATILDLYNYSPAKTSNVVSIRRFMVLNDAAVNVTLMVWS